MNAPAQTSLLGDDVVTVPAPRQSSEDTNDLRRVETVLSTAVEVGYMLGPGDRVARKVGDSVIALVPEAEAAAVRQLIRSRHLKVGGYHAVALANGTVSARSVLVPPATRNQVARWRSYKPLR